MAYKYELSICAIFQNEAPYLKEWIEFHKLQGVQHFYLYDNRSNDLPSRVLNEYVKRGEVTLINWPLFGQIHSQNKAYEHALRLTSGKSKWVAFLDTDEFLFCPTGKNICEFVKPFESLIGVAGVCVSWQMYGSSDVKCLEYGELLIEKLLLKGKKDYSENVHVKTIVRPEFAIGPNSPHCFFLRDGYFSVDSNHKRIDGPFNTDIPIDDIRINHYFARTLDFAYGEKLQRLIRIGRDYEGAKHRMDEFNRNCCVEQDDSILIYVPRLRKNMWH